MTAPTPTPASLQFSAASWIGDLKFLDNRALKDIVIPGSHDAGTFVLENRIDNNSSQCQDISIAEQLRAGSRYLDLRAWKASDDRYWLYHGLAWTHVRLADALADIVDFLDRQPDEIVIATLLIDEETRIDAGWHWACSQVVRHRVRPADLGGKSFAEATPAELRAAGRRLVFLRSGDVSQIACMDREGAYGDSLDPVNYLKALDNLNLWSDKMWILHLGIPYKGEIHNEMVERAGWNAQEFIPRFKAEGAHRAWQHRRLNIVNVDFIQRFGWVDALVRLNAPFPKTWPSVATPRTISKRYTWTLKAIDRGGMLHIEALSDAPFRAQQGQIHVYRAEDGFPADPGGVKAAWAWDNDAHHWNTGLKWQRGLCVAWVAEKSANGPYVAFVKLATVGDRIDAEASFTWTLRAAELDGKLLLEGDSDAPFRAQQGQLHVYPQHAGFPAGPNPKAHAWEWDNEAHPWGTGLSGTGWPVAWLAEQSPNGPYTPFLKLVV